MNLTAGQIIQLAFGFLIAGALITALMGGNWRRSGTIAFLFMAGATACLWTLAARSFTSGAVDIGSLFQLDILGANLSFRIDRLSAIFLFLVPFVTLCALLYAIEYMARRHPQESPRRYYPFALLLMAAITGVAASSDLFFFFIFWELMTLTSWALVWFERENEKSVRAAWTYFVVTHVAAACILIAALILYSKSGSFAFSDIAVALGEMLGASPALAHILLALFFLGFATKAGMFPLGGWLPDAYSAAPSPASAAFAGSMTKLAIYGIVRVFIDFCDETTLTTVWGGIIAALGAISIFVGTLSALQENDAKRLLSFHIIGQMGYILLGVGTGLFFLRSYPVLAVLALIAGLYHLVNNATYKPLLFLNAGAAEYQTGTRDLNKLGGLGALMPVTLIATIIASLSIAGIPPFSGFVSKWLIYQSTIQGGIRLPLFLLLGIVAMFISLVTLASFMKLIGSVFLGQISTAGERVKGEVPMTMRIPQIALSLVCVVLGVVPLLPLALLYGAAGDIVKLELLPGFTSMFGSSGTGVTLDIGAGPIGVWNPAYALIAIVVCMLIAYLISRAGHAPHRQTAAWYGGEEEPPEDVRYRAHGFVLPFKEVFAKIYPSIPAPRASELKSLRAVLDLDGWFYKGILYVGSAVTGRLSRWHSGLPQTYMLWQAVGFVIVVCVLFTWLVR